MGKLQTTSLQLYDSECWACHRQLSKTEAVEQAVEAADGGCGQVQQAPRGPTGSPPATEKGCGR